MLTERQLNLFTDILEQYIRTSEPVASQGLATTKKWNVSSATIRNEMLELEREGLIMQPHISAGRVPTEKGYQYYRDSFLMPETLTAALEDSLVASYREPSMEGLKNLARELAHLTELAVIVGFGKSNLYYTGISHLLEQPEFDSRTEIADVLMALEERESDITAFFTSLPEETAVFIGSENPFFPLCSFIAIPIEQEDEKSYMGILGPMRMEYGKALSLLQKCKNILTK